MLNRRRFVGLTAAAIAAPSMLASRALGANWPLRNVRIVVPFPPGGSTDITARLVGNRLQEVWGQTVVIENKPGAGGNIASEMVARSDPDGYTIFIVGPGLATNQFLYPSLSYDPVGDFAPVTLLITQPNVMCVPNSKPAKSVREFIDYCNDNRGKVTYASSGNGTTLHLSGELFKRLANVEMTHIPYRGGALAINDLLPGRVDVSFDNMPSILPHAKAGAVRALAVTTKERVSVVPDIPTIAESGVPGFDGAGWGMMAAPAATPKQIVGRLHAELKAIIGSPEIQDQILKLGMLPGTNSSREELQPFINSEMERWGKIVRQVGLAGTQ